MGHIPTGTIYKQVEVADGGDGTWSLTGSAPRELFSYRVVCGDVEEIVSFERTFDTTTPTAAPATTAPPAPAAETPVATAPPAASVSGDATYTG